MDKKTVQVEEISGCEGNCIAINEYRIACPKPWGGGHVIKKWDARVDHILKALGVDVAEVVRCGVCRHCDTADCPMRGTPGRVSASDFCSYGERKEA